MKFLVPLCSILCVVGVYCNDIQDFPITVPKAVIQRCAFNHELSEEMVKEIMAHKNFSSTRDARSFGACLLNTSGIVKDGAIDVDFAKSTAGQECITVHKKNVSPYVSARLMSCLFQKGFIDAE